MSKRQPRQITVEVRGSPSDEEHVRLEEFLDQLERIRAALRETERTITGREPSLYYRIVDMSHRSPARLVLEVASETEDDESTGRIGGDVVRHFTTNLRYISRKSQAPKTAAVPVLESYREMLAPLQRHVTEVVIKADRRDVVLNDHFRQAIEKVLGPEETTYGSISGTLEAINLHNTAKFVLYPTVGPARISGRFRKKAELRAKFTNAIDKYVTVHGLLRYKTWDKFPFAIIAEDIEVHGSDVTTLKQIKGMAPRATGELTSVEFLEQIRDEER